MTASLPHRIWWIALPIKLLIAVPVPLAHDEAYDWVWSHHPQLSDFDHPPMVAWLFWFGRFSQPHPEVQDRAGAAARRMDSDSDRSRSTSVAAALPVPSDRLPTARSTSRPRSSDTRRRNDT